MAKSDNRIVWVFAIGLMMAGGLWLGMRQKPVVPKLTKPVVDTTAMVVVDTSNYPNGMIDSAAALFFNRMNTHNVPERSFIANHYVPAPPVLTHHWNIPDCDSIKSISPCKVDTNGGFIEYNLHR